MSTLPLLLLAALAACATPPGAASPTAPAPNRAAAPPPSAPETVAEPVHPDEVFATLAGEAVQDRDWDRAMDLYAAAAESEDEFIHLVGLSGQLAVARQAAAEGDWPWSVAYEVTDALLRNAPERASQWRLWEADSRFLAGDIEGALAVWQDTAERYPGDWIMDKPVRSVSLRQAARAADILGESALAEALRSRAGQSDEAPPPPAVLSAACTPSEASDGFQQPFAPDTTNWGNRFMTYDTTSYSTNVYHPGEDMNAASDCYKNFLPVAKGCMSNVQAVSPTLISDEGAATMLHRHTHADTSTEYWTSSYWHAYYIYYSTGAAVTKSSVLGQVGKIGAASCHLHLEIREPDHPSKDDMDYWDTTVLGSQTSVGKYYQDPMAFITGHPNYAGYFWADEAAFTCTGTWTSSTDGDEGDSKYATTTSSTTTPSAYCTYAFTPSSTATYYVFAHIPWVNTSSANVNYTVYTTSSGTVKKNVRVNHGTGTDVTGYGCGTGYWDGNHDGELCDEWYAVTSFSATSGTSYTLKIGNNTGESSLKLALDDVLILRK